MVALGVSAWVGIITNWKMPLHVFETKAKKELNCNETRGSHISLTSGTMGPNFVLMDDNTRPHRLERIAQILEHEVNQCIRVAYESPDLTPIENAWHVFEKNVADSKP